jgi:hypothetical protein
MGKNGEDIIKKYNLWYKKFFGIDVDVCVEYKGPNFSKLN